MSKKSIETASFTQKIKIGKGILTNHYSIHLDKKEYLLFFTKYVVYVLKGNQKLKGTFSEKEFDTEDEARLHFQKMRKKIMDTID